MHELQLKYQKEIIELTEASNKLGRLGYVASHGGNLSLRADEDIVLITPTRVPKLKVTFDDIVILNSSGDVLFSFSGRKPTGEAPIHLNILKKRPDIKGLVHAHPPILTGFSMVDTHILSRPLLPEPIIELGPVLRVEYKEPLSEDLAAAFDNVLHKSNAFLMNNHGIMLCSQDGVERALELLEMLENMAFSIFVASAVGGRINEIPPCEVANLDRTVRTRGLPMPGSPGTNASLANAYFDCSD